MFFRDNGVAVFLDNGFEWHFRLDKGTVRCIFTEPDNFWEFDMGIIEYGWSIGVERADEVEQDGRVFTTRESYIGIVGLVPFLDTVQGHLYFNF